MKNRFMCKWLLGWLMLLTVSFNGAYAVSQPYPGFPSPPIVQSPIYECAEAVHVYNIIPHYNVVVFAGGEEVVGQATPHFGFVDVPLTRPLEVGESITAIQYLTGYYDQSPQSLVPVIVQAFTGTLGAPQVHDDIYECGRIVPVGELTESVKVTVFGDGSQIGQGDAPGTWQAIITAPLISSEAVTATQGMCGADGPVSPAVSVKDEPSVIPVPEIVTCIDGADSVLVSNLLPGATVKVYNGTTVIGQGWANATSNWVPLNEAISSSSVITVTQELCETPSTPSEVGVITTDIPTPILLEPIYDGQQFVRLQNIMPNAVLVITSNGASTVGIGTGHYAGDGSVVLGLNRTLSEGDVIVATQYFGSVTSPNSNSVTVVGVSTAPTTSAVDDEGFFHAETGDGEQAIDGPVYVRGNGDGPEIRVTTTDCATGLTIVVTDPLGTSTSFNTTERILPGYFVTHMDWSLFGFSTSDIPIGRYNIQITNTCSGQMTNQNMYIVFDPAEVDGEDRLSFNEVAVWFYGAWEFTVALSYQLHIDDARVFNEAINVVNGQTDQADAIDLLLNHEVGMFGWIDDHATYDVLDLMTHSNAQCADDASMLTALYRAVGIPARPAAVDMNPEQNPNERWAFDTWTEVKFDGPQGIQWYAVYPHVSSSPIGPVERHALAPIVDALSKERGDLIVTVNENWVASELDGNAHDIASADIDFHYDMTTECKEPAEEFDYAAPWMVHMCNEPADNHYWDEGHWECSPGWETDITIDVGTYYFVGDTVVFDVTVDNPTDTDKEGAIDVRIGMDNLFTKLYPDFNFNVSGQSIVVAAHTSETYTFRYTLPVNISADDGYTVIADATFISGHEDDGRSAPFDVNAYYTVDLDLPDHLATCVSGMDCTFTADLIIENITDYDVTDVDVVLTLPFGVQTLSGDKTVTVTEPTLVARDTIVHTFTLKIVESNDAANFVVDVTTADGGNNRESKTIPIVDPDVTMLTPGGEVIFHPNPVCGNGKLEYGEECDDGNTADGDGCSSECVIDQLTAGIYRIISVHSGKVLDVSDRSTADGGNIQQWSYANQTNQQFELVPTSIDTWEIQPMHVSGKCLDVAAASMDDGANIQQYGCNGTGAQQFIIIDMGDGIFAIVNENSGKCLDVSNFSTEDGGNIQQWDCHFMNNQLWIFEPVDGTTPGTLVPVWGQCGGNGGDCNKYFPPSECDELTSPHDSPWPGFVCEAGSTCVRQTEWYWQCIP